MKIEMTIEFPDAARRYIAMLSAADVVEREQITTDRGLATREACASYIKAVIAGLDKEGSVIPTGKLTLEEETDAKEAVTWLRAQGKTDGQIRAWLLLQKARFNFGPPRRNEDDEA